MKCWKTLRNLTSEAGEIRNRVLIEWRTLSRVILGVLTTSLVLATTACANTPQWLDDSSVDAVYTMRDSTHRMAEATWHDGTILRWSEVSIDRNWVRQGIAQTVAPDGQRIIDETTYVDGEKHGPYRAYFANGQLSTTGEFFHGRKWGFWTEYWEDGKKLRHGFWDEDQIGVFQTWYSNGQLHTEGSYAIGRHGDSVRVGWWSSYHSNGVLEMQGAYAANGEGKRGQWKMWHASGSLAATGRFSQDAATRLYPSSAPDGPWTYWHDNGQTAATGAYEAGKLTGEWRYWDPSGASISKATYDAKFGEGMLYVG